MITALLASTVFQPVRFEIDLALVADPVVNQKVISLTNTETSDADRMLLRYMKDHASGTQFAILDGSAPVGEKFTVDLSVYESSAYESVAAFVNKRKVMSEQTLQESVMRSSVTCEGFTEKYAGFAATYIHRSSDHSLLCAVMPLFSLRSSSSELPTYKHVGLFVTSQSTHEAETQFQSLLPNRSQIVVCRWGTQRTTAPNLISFPPPRKFKHYKVGFDGTNWYARLQNVVNF